MGETGILAPDARVELIDGEIVDMSPIGDRHAICVARLTRLLSAQAGNSAIVWPQNPIRLPDLSEPQPDLALVRPPMERYSSGKPGPADIFLIIEVAESSLVNDLEVKGPLYTRFAIPEYWIVDIAGNQLLLFSDPADGKYRASSVARPGQVLVPRFLPEVSVAVSEVLGVD